MELIADTLQTVTSGANVLFTSTPVKGNCSIFHREGSGLTTLRGITNQCRARFKISFGANVAIPEGGAVAPITLAIAVSGEALGGTTMISTPAATQQFNNVYSSVYLDVPACATYTVSVTNLSDASIDVQNANLIVERVA